MRHSLLATIRFLTTEEGGKSRTPKSGYRPHFDLGVYLTSVIINSITSDDETFELGREYEVELIFMFWDHVEHLVNLDAPFVLKEGKFTVGHGQFL